MEERISALMDGELDDADAAAVIDALASDRRAFALWSLYHLIGDAMREHAAPAAAPARRAPAPPPRLRFALSLAASLAAIALVGWLAFAPAEPPAPPLAAAPAPQVPASVPLPSGTTDYLFAHQAFSPRVSFQGMAPYVQTVSDEAREASR